MISPVILGVLVFLYWLVGMFVAAGIVDENRGELLNNGVRLTAFILTVFWPIALAIQLCVLDENREKWQKLEDEFKRQDEVLMESMMRIIKMPDAIDSNKKP